MVLEWLTRGGCKWRFDCIFSSVRRKRFRLVLEKRKTKEWDFRFGQREKWNENPKKKKKKDGGEGEGKEPFLPTSSPLFSYRHFSRGLRLSFFVLWSETVRKSLLRRLYVTSLTTIALPVPLHGHRTYFFPSSRLDW